MNIIKIILLNLLIISFSYASTFEELSSKLSDKSFKVKEEVLNELIVNYKEEDKLEILLQNMLAGNLYFNPTTNEILVSQNENFKSLFTNENVQTQEDFSKIKINNKLRSVIKSGLAKINLFSKNIEKRLKAAKNILANLEQEDAAIVSEALASEKNSSVKEILLESDTNLKAKFSIGPEQIEAIKKLGDFLSAKSLETLTVLSETSSDEEIKKVAHT